MKPSEIDFTLLLHKEKVPKEKITEVYVLLEKKKFDLDNGKSDKLKECLLDTGIPGEKIDRIIEGYEAQHPAASLKLSASDLENKAKELDKKGRELNKKERELKDREQDLERRARNLDSRERDYTPSRREDTGGDYHN